MRTRTLVVLLASLFALPVSAKTFCCKDAQGRQVCGDTLPEVCYDRAYREMSDRGRVIRQVDPPLTAEQKAQRAEELRLKREEDRRLAEQARRDKALVNTYGNETDIDYMRERALADVDKAFKLAEEKYNEAAKRKQELDNEAEFYKKKPMPPELKSQIQANDVELQAHKLAMDAKLKDADAIRRRFAEEKRRYIELTRGKSASAQPSQIPSGANSTDSRPR